MKHLSIFLLLALTAGCASFGTAAVPQRQSASYVAPASGGTYGVLYEFGRAGDALGPYGLLVPSKGVLYGSSYAGGRNKDGAVFGVTTQGKETLLASLPKSAPLPDVGPAMLSGTLYGGVRGVANYSDSALYSVAPSGKLTILRELNPVTDGNSPGQLTVLDGALYGTLQSGNGQIFRFTPSGAFKIVHYFGTYLHDGADPGYYVIAANGALYGTTCLGGEYDHGSVYSLTRSGEYKTLYSFKGKKDGDCPQAALSFANGTLYGTTSALDDVTPDYGTAFGLTLAGKETVIYNFKGRFKNNCQYPDSGVEYFKGSLYGVCDQGGAQDGYLYNLTLSGQFSILHEFVGGAGDGNAPVSVVESGGTFYGITEFGGKNTSENSNGGGTLFSYAP